MDFEKIKKIFKNNNDKNDKNKNIGTLIILILIGVLLIIGSNFFKGQTSAANTAIKQSSENSQSNTANRTKK